MSNNYQSYTVLSDYDKICSFDNLLKAHKKARKSKQSNHEVIQFEVNLGYNLVALSKSLKEGTYRISGYYSFVVHDPKLRTIHALHYWDRVVQHALCDEVLAPLFEKRLIYDNAACRTGKGTHFAMDRVALFLRKYYKKYQCNGYFLKCDIRKFFDSIDHEVLKQKLKKVIKDQRVFTLLNQIIDSYETAPGKGLPLGNQTSQWFALYYLDELDRLVKEKLRVPYYSRYMDDCLLIHNEKSYLKFCLQEMNRLLEEDLLLEFNEKTQIFPLKNGVDYLGYHFYMTETGKIVRKVRNQTKKKYKRKLKYMAHAYKYEDLSLDEIKQVLSSYHAHFSHGDCYLMEQKALAGFVLSHSREEDEADDKWRFYE